jgi:hypothetical protein
MYKNDLNDFYNQLILVREQSAALTKKIWNLVWFLIRLGRQ